MSQTNSLRTAKTAFFAVAVSLLTLVAWWGYSNYASQIKVAESRSKNLAALLKANFLSSLTKIDLSLKDLGGSSGQLILQSALSPSYVEEVTKTLSQTLSTTPLVKDYAYVDAKGHIAYASSPALLQIDISVSSYYQQAIKEKKTNLLFAADTPKVKDQDYALALARPVFASDGRLLGMVLALVGQQAMAQLVPSDEVDGQTRLHVLPTDAITQAGLPSLTADGKAGTLTMQSAADGVERVAAFTPVAPYPLYAVVAVAKPGIVLWLGQIVLAVAVLLGVLVMLWQALRKVGQEHRDLQQAIDTLTASNEQAQSELAELAGGLQACAYPVVIRDQKGDFVFSNRAFALQYGTTPDDLRGKNDSACGLANLELARLHSDIRSSLEQGNTTQKLRHITDATAGKVQHTQVVEVPFTVANNAGRLLHIEIPVDQIYAEQADEAAKVKELEALLRASGDAKWLWNLRSGQMIGDSAWQQLLGLSLPANQAHAAILFSDYEAMLPEAERNSLMQQLWTALEETGSFVLHHVLQAQDGVTRHVALHGVVLEQSNNGQAHVVVGVLRERAQAPQTPPTMPVPVATTEATTETITEETQHALAAKEAAMAAELAEIQRYCADLVHSITRLGQGMFTMLEVLVRQPRLGQDGENAVDTLEALSHELLLLVGATPPELERPEIALNTVSPSEASPPPVATVATVSTKPAAPTSTVAETLAAVIPSNSSTQIPTTLPKLNPAEIVLSPSRCHLVSLAQEVAIACREAADRQGLQLHAEVVEELVAQEIEADPIYVKQILQHLLQNAIAHSSKGRVSLRVQTADHPETVVFRIADTGVGISPELLQTLLATSANEAANDNQVLAGIPLCHKLAERMGGVLHIESTRGQGTVCTLSLPLRCPRQAPRRISDSAPNAISTTASANTTTSPNTDHKTPFAQIPYAERQSLAGAVVMLIDDNAITRQVANGMLEWMGCQAIALANAHEALARIRTTPVDLLLVDIKMPGMNGRELTRLLRQGEAGEAAKLMPIIGLDTQITDEKRQDCQALGMFDCVSKAIDLDALAEVLLNAARTNPETFLVASQTTDTTAHDIEASVMELFLNEEKPQLATHGNLLERLDSSEDELAWLGASEGNFGTHTHAGITASDLEFPPLPSLEGLFSLPDAEAASSQAEKTEDDLPITPETAVIDVPAVAPASVIDSKLPILDQAGLQDSCMQDSDLIELVLRTALNDLDNHWHALIAAIRQKHAGTAIFWAHTLRTLMNQAAGVRLEAAFKALEKELQAETFSVEEAVILRLQPEISQFKNAARALLDELAGG